MRINVCFPHLYLIRGSVCGAGAYLGEWRPSFPVSDTERIVLDRERETGLFDVMFPIYENAVKRYGYSKGVLNDDCLREISTEINFTFDELEVRSSVQF